MKTKPDNTSLQLAPVNAPKLSTGDDKSIAKELNKRFNEAQNGMRRIVALGLFAIEIRETKLKHGQFGPWLAANAPKLCRLDSATGKPKATHALSSYLEITAGVLETVGLNEEKYCALISNSPQGGIWSRGKLLLLSDKKVPEDVRPLREKICSLVDGKTQKQVMMDFKQVEEDGNGKLKSKRGRLKGQGGATAAQRAAAQAAEESARIEAMELTAEETEAWITENADDKGFGLMSDKRREQLLEAFELGVSYLKRFSKKG